MAQIVLRSLMVLGWTAALPLVGYSVFAILTIIPMLGALLGLVVVGFIYAGGAVPAFVTAAAFEWIFRKWSPPRSIAATTATGAVASVAWIAFYTFQESGRALVGADYLTAALAVAGASAAALMPLTRFAKDRRRWR